MRELTWYSFLLTVLSVAAAAQQTAPLNLPSNQLPSNQVLANPMPGTPQRTNSLPSNIVVSPDGKYAAILNGGRGTDVGNFQQSIAVLDLTTNKITDFPDERLAVKARQTYFLGLAFTGRGDELYVSVASLTDPEGKKEGSTGNGIAVYSFREGRIAPLRFLKIAVQRLAKGKRFVYQPKNTPAGMAVCYPAGMAVVGGERERIVVACNLSDSVLELDAQTGEVLHTFDVSEKEVVPAAYPYTVVASKDRRRAWVSLWNTSQVAELDLEAGKVARKLEVASGRPRNAGASAHATGMTLNADENELYVAIANEDRVQKIDLGSGKVVPIGILLRGQSRGGSYPVSLADKEGTIYVACAGLNAVALIRDSRVVGFVPTEWYPTAVAVRGNDLLVASGKGRGTGPNNRAPFNDKEKKKFAYIVSLLYGSLARVDIAEATKHGTELTEAVRKSNRLTDETVKIKFHPQVVKKNRYGTLRRAGAPVGSPIKHVIYVIKENRTYDQMLGDLGVGDGDKSLTMFGWDVAPNHHKLALQFGVLDNFYDSGDISGNGHVWSTAATTSDYTERTWPIGYRGRERAYDYEGQVGDAYPMQLGIPDIDEPGTGFLWANAARNFLTYRHYGEFVDTAWCTESEWGGGMASTGTTSKACARKEVKKGEALPATVGEPRGGASPWPWAVPMIADNVPTKPELVGHFNPRYADFKSEYPDQLRMDEFMNEFEKFVEARKDPNLKHDRDKLLPELVVLRLPNDHTLGTKVGWPTPAAAVADNDLALGRLVEAVSQSPYWEDTAILVLEDDAQDGPDHVDAHRSVAYVISKYAPYRPKRPVVDHRFYTTVNMIRTLEDVLGLPPMNIRDAYAAPIAPLFSGKGLQPPFSADRRNLESGMIYEVNPPDAAGAKESAELDFSTADVADTAVLNAILWRNRMGNRPMPKPQHRVIHDSAQRHDD